VLLSASYDTRSAWTHIHRGWVVTRVMPRHLVVAPKD
jgi:hypothetical protein